LGEGALVLEIPKDQSVALEALSRPNNKKILADIAKELEAAETASAGTGFEIRVAIVG
jgi:hypothetical protein